MKLSMPGTAVLLILTVIALSFAVTPVIAQPVEVRVNAPEYAEEGATFVVTIGVDNVIDLERAQFDLSFDPDVVKISDVNEAKIGGEDISIWWVLNPDKDTVRVIITMDPGEGVSGSGYLAEIEFVAEGNEGDESVLNISNGLLGVLSDKIGSGNVFSTDKKFEDELNDGEISDELKEIFEDNGYLLENPTVKVIEKDKRWKIIDEKRVYSVRVDGSVLKIFDTGEIVANWIDAEIRIGVEEEEEEEVEEEEVPPGAPVITAWEPADAAVSNAVGESRTFNITVDQIAAVSWQINGSEVQTNESTREAFFTKSAVIGTWNVSATAINTTTGLSDVHTWIWSVTATATVTPTPTEVVGEIPPAETEAEGTPTPTLAPRVTPKPTAAPPTEKKPTPTATPTPAVPGFEAVFAIAVLLAIAYILRRRGESEGGQVANSQ